MKLFIIMGVVLLLSLGFISAETIILEDIKQTVITSLYSQISILYNVEIIDIFLLKEGIINFISFDDVVGGVLYLIK